MQAALEKFKKERPEEFQEYHEYVMDILRIRIWMFSLVFVSICLIIASYVWIGVAWCIVLFLTTGIGLVIVFKRLKHKLHVTKLTIALIEMTFKDHSTIPSSLQDELKDIFKSKE
jgi:disulfide bond formation protein DsbB